MGLEFQEGDFKITQYSTTEKAEIRLDNAVGFSRQADGTFSMVGDFYNSDNPKLRKFYNNTSTFQRELNNAYAIEETIAEMERQQFFCANTEETDDELVMVFERY